MFLQCMQTSLHPRALNSRWLSHVIFPLRKIWTGPHNVRSLIIFRTAHIQASCSAVHHCPSCVLPLFLMFVAGWLFPFFRWPWQARRAKLGSWGGPESITAERSSAQESNSDQLDVTYHHLFRPDREWVYTKCASDVETQTYFLCFLVIFSFSSLTLVPLCVPLSVSVSICICSFPTFYFPLLLPLCPPHHSCSSLISCFVSTASLLPVCLPSEWIHINNSLYASGPAGFLNTWWSVCLCVQAKATTHWCHSYVATH